MYRALEAHFSLYLALYKLYIDKFIDSHQIIERHLKEGVVNAITSLSDYHSNTKRVVQLNHEKLLEAIESVDLINMQEEFDNSLTHQSKFYRNYMLLFELLLLFIRASREQSWNLHLNTLHNLCPYFFAFDMLNYARMTPVYLSQMFKLKDEDQLTWHIMESGNFSVNKSRVPFSAIGADHGIEQENRALKVLGGIKGLANSNQALNEYFLTAAELGNIVESFCETFGIEENQSRKRDEHYQLSGSKNQRITNNVTKISTVFNDHVVNFDSSDVVYNVLTRKVLPSAVAERFLAVTSIGQEKYNDFVKQKLEGKGSIWDPLKKEKLNTFSSNNKNVTVTVSKQLVQVREERKLMTRLLIASRTRPDIDLPSNIGMYEFSVVPRSLFTIDGTLHQTTDKSVIAAELCKSQKVKEIEENTEQSNDNRIRKVIIFDGMAIVNRINIKKQKITNCAEFADQFINIIKREASGFDEVRVVFDRYKEKSLKANTRAKRTKGVSVQYKISDVTQIGHLVTKQFLSSIKTKNDLTEYLTKKLQLQLDVEYVIVYRMTCVTNILDLDPELKSYTHEEADTGIVLHAIDVCKRDPFTDLVISCSDTDVLLILLHYFDELSSSTIFRTTQHDITLQLVYESIGPHKCKAILGFHAFTGCDQTGKFYGHSKFSCWKVFMSSTSQVIAALSKLGESIIKPTEVDVQALEHFVMHLYCKKIPSTVEDLADLRWHMFSKQQSEAQKLPPTRAALTQKILRAHYTTFQWKSSHISSPVLPNPEEFGWKWLDDSTLFEPVMTTLLPAPESVIDLSMCRCQTNCKTLRCKCRKNNLNCTEMCLCTDCDNIEMDEDLEHVDSDSDNYDIDDDE